jgi:hypothetical protein
MTDEDTSAEACPEAKPPAPSGARAHLDQVQALLQNATLFYLPAALMGLLATIESQFFACCIAIKLC